MDHDELRAGQTALERLLVVLPTVAAYGVSAVAWAACFQRQSLLIVPWIALVPFMAPALRGRGHSLPLRWLVPLAWLHGILFWWLSIPWIVPTLVQFGGLPRPLSWCLMLLLTGYLGAYHGLFAFVLRVLSRRTLPLLLAPAVWILLDGAQEFILTGFPWNLAGYSVIDLPGVLPSSSVLGVTGWSFLVIWCNVALAQWWRRGFAPGAAVKLVPVLAITLFCLAVGLWRQNVEDPESVAALRVAIVQPNTAIELDVTADVVLANYRRLLQLSRCETAETLIVWPESAAWPYVYSRDQALQRDVAAITKAGCPVLLNSSRREGEAYFNTAILLAPDARPQQYDKTHLVPFGEFVPLADLLPFVGQLARNAGSFSAGESLAPLLWKQARLGMSICFEITFASEVAARTRAGANVLVTLTNDAWYGDSSAPWQHLRAARFRAAENSRPVLRAAITGVSASIDRHGNLEQTLGLDEAGVLRLEARPNEQLAWFTRFPRWVEAISALILLLGIGWRRLASGNRAQ